MLEIKNLHVSIDGKEILKGLNLKVENGTVHAIMGPNGSGKSTLANVIMGHPKYTVTKGDILLDGKSILGMKPDERARKGVFLSFQYPAEISGVTISNFLRTAVNSVRVEKLGVLKFKDEVAEKMKFLKMDPAFLGRYLNQGFSGGEKKRAEILQLLMLNPKVALLDETDSGLDIDALKIVSEGVNHYMHDSKDKAVLIITHYKRILEYVKPNKISILMDGKIVHEGKGDLADNLEEKGYAWVKEEAD